MRSPTLHQTADRIVGLDGLRAVSILLVLAGHSWQTLALAEEFKTLGHYFANGARMGVSMFFVVSGYLITHLLHKEWELTGTFSLKAFYARRVLRIFPAFYTYLLVVSFLRFFGWIDTTYGDILTAGVFLKNYQHAFAIHSNDSNWFVGHFWTLSLEEQFYLLWPVTILLVGMLRAHRVAFLIVLSSPLIRVITYYLWPASRGQLGIMLHTAAEPIMLGCLAALWQHYDFFERGLRRWASRQWPFLAAIFVLIISPTLVLRFGGMYGATIGMSLESIAVAFIMLWIIRHPKSLLVRILSTSALCHIGTISYSLYLWQQLFLTPRNQSWTGVFPVSLVLSFAIAQLSFSLIERPFLRSRDRHRSSLASKSE